MAVHNALQNAESQVTKRHTGRARNEWCLGCMRELRGTARNRGTKGTHSAKTPGDEPSNHVGGRNQGNLAQMPRKTLPRSCTSSQRAWKNLHQLSRCQDVSHLLSKASDSPGYGHGLLRSKEQRANSTCHVATQKRCKASQVL